MRAHIFFFSATVIEQLVSEFRVEYLNPPYMTFERPVLRNVPSQIGFHENFTIGIDIPGGLEASNIQGQIRFALTA